MNAPSREPISRDRVVAGVRGRTMLIMQGEQGVSDDADVVMTTLLGSCVAACLHDPLARIGGMNHFLLPGDTADRGSGAAERQAAHAMELLVDALLARGASRRRLEAKVFGGAATLEGLADIGSSNASFATQFLERESIAIVGSCLRGRRGRRVQYWPVSGRARRSFMSPIEMPVTIVRTPRDTVEAGSLELF